MGTWGEKNFQNDDACDIRDSYREKLIVGVSDVAAEDAIIIDFDSNECLWLPLAITQWKIGRLSERVKNHALGIIEHELENLTEYWKGDSILKRSAELIRARETLCSAMPRRKELKQPNWAWKCPWNIGSVLQFKVRYPIEDNPIYNQYVLIQILGITDTPPDKIPCETISVGLYNWHDCRSPATLMGEILANPPARVDFLTKSGVQKSFHCILPTIQMMKENEIQCISKTPLQGKISNPSPVYAPMNSTFDKLISRTLIAQL